MACLAVATDFSPRADRAVDRAKMLQTQLGGELCVIHATNRAVDDPPDMDALDQRMRWSTGLTGAEDTVSFLYPSGSPPAAIADTCEAKDVDLLLIGPARYNTLGDYFLGTAVDYVLRSTTRPVLVVKNRAHADYSAIVAGTDFSPGAANAILTASQMFPDATFHIVNAWQVPFQAFNKDAYVSEEIERDHQALMKNFMEELVARDGRLANATSELVRGDAVDALRKGLEMNPTALAVVGSHGASGFRQATIGSATSDMLRYLEADTLVVNASGTV